MSLGRRRQLRVDPANSVPRVQMAAFGALQPAHHRDKKGTIDMKTKNKHQTSGGEVMELARETAKLEQYWIVGDPKPSLRAGCSGHRLYDIVANGRRTPVILMRAGEVERVIILVVGAIDQAVPCRRKLRRVAAIIRPVLPQALGAEIYSRSHPKNMVGLAVIDREAPRQPRQTAEPAWGRKVEGVVDLVGSGQEHFVEQQG